MFKTTSKVQSTNTNKLDYLYIYLFILNQKI